MAAEAASFNTEILSMSLGSTSFIVLVSIPSTKIYGSAVFNVPTPRTRIVAPSCPGRPWPAVIVTPGIVPCKAVDTFCTGRLSNILLSTWATAPVIFTFFCVPYPTTTTSSSFWVSSTRFTAKVACPVYLISCVI